MVGKILLRQNNAMIIKGKREGCKFTSIMKRKAWRQQNVKHNVDGAALIG